ncbi:MAG: glutathione-disulfide reductase [Gammaproteobacteria bacterium]|nr:glutathione-disulfide reductase [Gammaproteobacteria bacterium]
MEEFDYDLFVIGAGSGGVRACRIAASLGARVAVAEERYFGGTCVNVGCVPKKLFSYAAHYLDDLEDSRGFGWDVPEKSFNWSTLLKNKNKEINRLNGIYKAILDNNQVQVFQARARIKDAHTVEVANKLVTAKYILIATGGWPWIPQYEGSEHVITSNDVFFMENLPKRLLVVGGGYIAVEFASIFTRLGSNTVLSYRGDQLLRGFDDEIRHFTTVEIGKRMDLKLSSNIIKISKNDNGLRVYFDSGDEIVVDCVLSATGRKPLTANLGLENVNIALADNGAVVVNEHFQTGEPSIYAVGDVIDRVSLTPVALAEGQIVARALFSSDPRAMDYQNIPTAVFSHPNLATCGLSEQVALNQGFNVDIFVATVKQLKHTLSGRDELSMIKLVVDQDTDRVIGLHMVGPDAGELVQGFAVAMNAGATKADFDRTIGIHPTLAEEFVTMRTKRKQHQE